MHNIEIVRLDKLGRNVFFPRKETDKIIILNEPTDAIPVCPYPLGPATGTETLQNGCFYDSQKNDEFNSNLVQEGLLVGEPSFLFSSSESSETLII